MSIARKATSVLCALTLSVGLVPSAAFAVSDPAPQESEKSTLEEVDGGFSSYSINGVDGVIDYGNHTVTVTLPQGTDVTNLVPTWEAAPEQPWPVTASDDGGDMFGVSDSGESALNFTNPVLYKITDSSWSEVLWTVTVVLSGEGGGDGGGEVNDPVVTIGKEQSETRTFPFGNYYNNAASEQIYTAAEIGSAGTISSIAFKVRSVGELETGMLDIYLGHLPASTTLEKGYVEPTDLTKVYSGTPTLGTKSGWEKFAFTEGSKTFSYNGRDNLAVIVVRGGTNYKSSLQYYCTPTDVKLAYSCRDDSTSLVGKTPSQAFDLITGGSPSYDRSDIQLGIALCSHANKTFVEHVAATCTTAGYDKYTCSDCGNEVDVVTEGEPALDHDFQVVEVHAPDCTHSGYTDYKCSRCDATKSGDEVNKLGHDWQQTSVVPATCTEASVVTFTCSRCQETKTESVGEPNGHSFNADHVCDVCGAPEPGFGGEPITIGADNLSKPYFPIFGDTYNSLSEQIYTASEIGGAHTIKSIAFNCTSTKKLQPTSFKIYLGHYSSTALKKYTVPTDMTLVYSGTPVIGIEKGWQTFDFNESLFNYNGTDSLAVIVVESTDSEPYSLKFACSNTETASACSYGSNYVAYDPTKANPSSSDYREGERYRPNVQLGFVEKIAAPAAIENLVYSGMEQTGVAAGKGYTLEGATATDAGDYTATAKLAAGYMWDDGTTDDKTISYSIAKAKLNAAYAGETIMLGDAPALAVTVTGFVNGETAETAAGFAAPTVSAPDPQEAGTFGLTPQGGAAKNYEFTYTQGDLVILDKSKLNAAIAEATGKLEGVLPSVDGSDLYPDKTWATQADIDSLKAAIAEAQKVADDKNATQDQVNSAQIALETAASAFKVSAGTKVNPPDCGFADVKAEVAEFGAAGVWYVADGWLDYVVTNGVMSGYAGSADFGPYDALTRGQAAAILYRAFTGATASTTDNGVDAGFPDVAPGSYCAAAVRWCAERGIVTGYEGGEWAGTFRPDAPVSREELATMVARYACYAETSQAGVLPADEGALSRFADAGEVDGYARAAMAWCCENGVVGGVGGTSLAPHDGAWRASMAKMITVVTRDVLKA